MPASISYCILRKCAHLQISAKLKRVSIRHIQINLQVELMALLDRYMVQVIFLMHFEASSFMVCALASPSPLKLLRTKRSPALGNQLRPPQVLDIQCSGQASSLPCSLFRPNVPTCTAFLCSCQVAMIRQRLISHHGGSIGGHGQAQTSHQASQAMTPPSSPSHKTLSIMLFKISSSISKAV